MVLGLWKVSRTRKSKTPSRSRGSGRNYFIGLFSLTLSIILLLVVGRLIRPSRSSCGLTSGMASAFFNSLIVGTFILFPCSISAAVCVSSLHVLKRDGVAVAQLFDVSDQHADLTASIVDQPRPLADGERDGAHCAASIFAFVGRLKNPNFWSSSLGSIAAVNDTRLPFSSLPVIH